MEKYTYLRIQERLNEFGKLLLCVRNLYNKRNL